MINQLLESVPLELNFESKIQISDEDFKLIEAMVQHAASESSDMNAGDLIKIGNIYFFKGDWHKTLNLYNTALIKAKSNNELLNQAHCLINSGTVWYLKIPEINEFNLLQTALNIFSEAEFKEHYANLIVNNTEWKSHKKEILSRLQEALCIYETLSLPKEQAIALEKIADIQRSDRTQEYIITYERAIRIYLNIKNFKEAARLYNVIPGLNMKINDPSRALSYHQKALELCENGQYLKETADTKTYMGDIYFLSKEYDKAIEMFLSAMELYETVENGDNRLICRIFETYHNLGILYHRKKEYQKAIHYYRLACEKGKETGYGAYCGLVASELGNIYFCLHDYNNAINYYLQAVEYDNRPKKHVARDLLSIGICYSNKRESNLGLKFAVQSLDAYKKINDREGIAAALGNIGLIYIEQHDYPNSLSFLSEALAITQADHDDRRKSWILLLFGIYKKVTSCHNDALRYFKDALSLAVTSGNKENEENAREQIGLFYYEHGDYDQARNYLRNIEKPSIAHEQHQYAGLHSQGPAVADEA